MGKKGLIKGNDLTLKEEEFCRLYITNEEFFGNGVQSYIKAFNPNKTKKNWYNNIKSRASDLLTKQNLLKRINELLDIQLNEEMADKQLAFLVLQHKDLFVKLGALKHFNELRGRIIKKIEHSGGILMGHLIKKVNEEDNGQIPEKTDN